MDANGGSSLPRNSEIPLIKLRSPQCSPSARSSMVDDGAQPQNLIPHSNVEASRKGSTRVDGGLNSEIDKLAFIRNPSRDPKPRQTEIDIIGVPAIGGDPEKTWMPQIRFVAQDDKPSLRSSEIKSAIMSMTFIAPAYPQPPPKSLTMMSPPKTEPPWITGGIRKELNMARVLLYDHGYPKNGDTLKRLAKRLLDNIKILRSIEEEHRPLFFISHSTGGLVVKVALNEARKDPNYRSILHDCYGVTFFATPHRGSSYLSHPGFLTSIRGIMGLSRELPASITKQLELDHPSLQQIGKDFKALATDLKVWSFFETLDSDLTTPDQGKPFHAPITSIKSAILNLRNETVYPLVSAHANCAAFGFENRHTKETYLQALAASVRKACELSKVAHFELNLEERIKVEINGFYEGKIMAPKNEPQIRVWSTNRSIRDFMSDGPTKLLEERREEASFSPATRQYLRHDTRARSINEEMSVPVDKGKSNDSHLNPKPASKLNPFRRGSSPSPSSRRGRAPKNKKQPKIPAVDVIGQNISAPSPPTLAMTSIEMDDDIDNQVGTSTDFGAHMMLNASSPDKKSNSRKSGILDAPTRASSDQRVEKADHSSGTVTLQPPITESRVTIDDTATRPRPLRRHSEAQPKQVSFLSPYSSAGMYQNRSTSSLEFKGIEGVVNPTTLPLQNPNSSKLKLKWIHVPFNNPTWVQDVLSRISVEKGPDIHSRMLDSEHWHSKHVRGRHHEHHHAYYLKPHCSFFGLENVSPLVSAGMNIDPVGINPAQMCLYLPYLHFDTYKVLVKRRKLVKRRLSQGRSRPVPQKVSKLDSEEFQVLWQYMGHDPPMNVRRTLDQFGYPGLLDTRARDDDQMLYKMTKERVVNLELVTNSVSYHEREAARKSKTTHEEGEEEDDDDEIDGESGGFATHNDTDSESDDDVLDGNVLMVDQLWLWIVDSGSVVTFFPRRAGLMTDGRLYQQADLRNSIFNEVNADLTSRCENAYDLAALVVLHAVTILFERTSHPDLEVFRIFEEAISILTEKMTSSFKSFRARGFRDKANDTDDLRTSSIRAKHHREGEIAEKQNRDNTSALLELRDIEDELKTLKTLFTSQMTEIREMLDVYEKRNLTINGLMFLKNAEDSLEEYTQHVERMIESVRSTRDDFDKLLGMIQRQAQVDEVRLSRYQADLASAQSRSVMIFTVFTVIFLPLGFFTSLFGMNVQEWGGGDNLPLRTVGAIALPTSSALITLALIIAWSTRIRLLFNSIGSTSTSISTGTYQQVHKTMHAIFSFRNSDKRNKRKVLSRRKKERRMEGRRTRLQDEDWDFWESHKERREKDYSIPSQNRKSGFGMGYGLDGEEG